MPDTSQLPEITDIQRLTLKLGDRIIIRVDDKLAADMAARLYERVRAQLGIPDDVPIAILDQGMSLEVVGDGA